MGLWSTLLAAWRLNRGSAQPPNPDRWVVVDVETTGLDPQRDALLSIAAFALHRTAGGFVLAPGDRFEVVLQQSVIRSSRDNILLHGIGVGRQGAGVPPAQALNDWLQWLGDSPLLAYHAAFDQAFLARTCREQLGHMPSQAWLDLAELAPAACPQDPAPHLDGWMARFGIVCAQRHQAAADAWATAELFLALWPRLQRLGARHWADLDRLAREQRWLKRAGRPP